MNRSPRPLVAGLLVPLLLSSVALAVGTPRAAPARPDVALPESERQALRERVERIEAAAERRAATPATDPAAQLRQLAALQQLTSEADALDQQTAALTSQQLGAKRSARDRVQWTGDALTAMQAADAALRMGEPDLEATLAAASVALLQAEDSAALRGERAEQEQLHVAQCTLDEAAGRIEEQDTEASRGRIQRAHAEIRRAHALARSKESRTQAGR